MQFPLNSSLSHTIFRLGTWYGLYRLIIAVSLNIILVLTDAQIDNSLQQPTLYSYTLLGYSLLSLLQLLCFKFIATQATRQLILFFVVDIICLSLLTFSVGEPNLQLSLLYVIAIFTSAILLSARMSLLITDRGGDILLLANHFIQKVCTEWGISSKQLTASAETYLLQQDFPGNVRELRNMIERAITLSDDESIDLTHLAPPLRGSSVSPQIVTKQLNQTPTVQTHPKFPMEGLERYLENIEKDILLNALNMTHWNRTLAAKKLGMTFRSLRYRLKKFGLDTEMGEEV